MADQFAPGSAISRSDALIVSGEIIKKAEIERVDADATGDREACTKCGTLWVPALHGGRRPGCDCHGLDGDHPPVDGSEPVEPDNFQSVGVVQTPKRFVRRQRMEMVEIPEGSFLFGENKEPIILGAFEIARYPVTNAQYKAFVDATGHRTPDHWEGGTFPKGKTDHPVVNVSLYDAEACAAWYGVRLPTEQEWEKAARGTDGREYPWGDGFDEKRCNTREKGYSVEDITPVGCFPDGASPYGVMDMAGNVWEWTSSKYESGHSLRVLRGGSWGLNPNIARCTFRFRITPDYRDSNVGFRCARTL